MKKIQTVKEQLNDLMRLNFLPEKALFACKGSSPLFHRCSVEVSFLAWNYPKLDANFLHSISWTFQRYLLCHPVECTPSQQPICSTSCDIISRKDFVVCDSFLWLVRSTSNSIVFMKHNC